jgi:hypothetical protein
VRVLLMSFLFGGIVTLWDRRYVDDKDSSNNFSFKCHRKDQTPSAKDQSLVYAVNDISFHPIHGTFSTCGKSSDITLASRDYLVSYIILGSGADGTIHFWDKDGRIRLKCTYHSILLPLSAQSLFFWYSIRSTTGPNFRDRFQQERIDLCLCHLVRLAQGTFRDDA